MVFKKAGRERIALMLGQTTNVDEEAVADLLTSGTFDARWYASTYKDVGESGMTPAEHYLWLGAKLGRARCASIAPVASGTFGGRAGPLKANDREIDALFVDGTNGTSSTPYRVHRIASGLAHDGWVARWISGEEVGSITERDLKPKLVVFHRAPYWADLARLADKLRAQGATIVFDVDDLIFDEELIPLIDGFRQLTSAEKEGFVRGVRAYRDFVLYADYCTAPTNYLVEQMQALGKQAYRVRNAISSSNIRFFEQVRYRRTGRPTPFVVGYYSGTKTHQADFAVVAPALTRFMTENKDVVFRLIGELDLEEYPELRRMAEIRRRGDLPRVTRVGLMPQDVMIRDQLSCDLIIAPLEVGNPFCEAKSELKFFEASLASCPVIASPTQTFVEGTEHGTFADLAGDSDAWFTAFSGVYSDYDAALSRARAAFGHVRHVYSQSYAAGEALAAYRAHLTGYEAA